MTGALGFIERMKQVARFLFQRSLIRSPPQLPVRPAVLPQGHKDDTYKMGPP